MLDQARARARELGHRGALFPWRTIDGEEASAYYAAGTAQYHIDADIAYALKKYVDVTDDVSLLYDGGAEIMVETARLWADMGCYSDELDGAFVINGVTGPDEYTAIVNNNRYTNMMARENLRAAGWAVSFVRTVQPETFTRLVDDTGLDLSELEAWQHAAEKMYLPVDPRTGIHPQDDTFLAKAVWPFEETKPEQHPLMLHFHPLVLYRHQVIKQADVVMAMFLLSGDFSLEEKRRNFDYYDPLTTRDSSLSSCIQSIVAMEIGYEEKALDYFLDAAMMDLADVGGNVMDGVHVASCGGVWMALVYGFGGLREDGVRTSLRPRLPPGWTRLRFPIAVHGKRLEVDIGTESVTYTLQEGSTLRIRHDGEDLSLELGCPVQRPVARRHDPVAAPGRPDAGGPG
jgi:alpha,alpha-trehalose phosphorylase